MITTADPRELHRLRVNVDAGWHVETVPHNFYRLASGMMQAEHRALDRGYRLRMVEGAIFFFPYEIETVKDFDRLMAAWEETTKN